MTEALTFIGERRTESAPFDAVAEGITQGDDRARAVAIVRPKREAGATRWLEANRTLTGSDVQVQLVKRLRQGPPKVG